VKPIGEKTAQKRRFKTMKSQKSRTRVSIGIAVMFMAAFILGSWVRVPAVMSQSISTVPSPDPGMDGTTSDPIPTEDEITSVDQFEEVDKDSVEADPTVPDDTQTPDGGTVGIFTVATPLPGGVDHVANGVGTRNLGKGTIRLRGVPFGAVAVRAWLYWGTIIRAAAPPATDTAVIDGVKVTGTLVGSSLPPCWPGDFFVAYRASVIARLKAGINGDYVIEIATSAVASNGQDSWFKPTPPNPLSEGASLVVEYADRDVAAGAKVYYNNFARRFFGPIVINNGIFPALPAYTVLKHTRLGADGQVGISTIAETPITDERTFLAGVQIRGTGGGINLDPDWNGNDGGPLNQLWDTHSDTFTQQLIKPGALNYQVRYVANGDCIVAVAHILGVK
jgi:hypothetical protein